MIEFRFCQNCDKIASKGTKCPICGENIELKEANYFIGKLFGKYKIEGILGQGGMGVVFLARHTILGRLSALKIIIPDLVTDADTFVERFLREAQLLAGLKHPNIIDIYDFDISEYGLPYYAMEFVEGISLRNLLASDGRNLTVDDFGSILKMCASALDYSHKKGIVHRDLKPENIIISISESKPMAKILDFGIAKILSEEGSKTLTGEGNIIGTLHYIAPEQVLGGKISPKTDQYSFALIVAEILSGKILREGKTLGEICASDIQKPLCQEIFPEKTNPITVKAIQKATSKDPDERFETVSDFVAALEIREPEKPEKLISIIERKTVGVSPTIIPQFNKDVLSQLSSKKSKTMKSPAKTAQPTLKKKQILPYIALFSGLLILAGLFAYFVFKKGSKEEAIPNYPICQKIGDWQVPPDSNSILSSLDGDSVLLKGAKSLYLIKLSSSQIPSSFPIETSEEFIGITPDEEPLFLKNGKIIRKNYSENSETILFDPAKEKFDWIRVSNSCRTLALGIGKKVKFYSLLFEKPLLLSTVSLDYSDSEIKKIKLSDKYFAFIANDFLNVFEIEKAKQILNVPFSENVFKIFIDDVSDNIALCGWFDKIAVFSLAGGENKELPIKGESRDIIILPDRPTIAVVGTYGIKFFDLKNSEVLFENLNEEINYDSLYYSPKGVLALSKDKSTIALYSFRTAAPEKIIKVCDKDIWSITKDFKNETLYAGGIDGKIYGIDKNYNVSSKELHTLGVTALATYENHLISSSDDKSIAVFKLPSLEVEFRSTAHNYLINYLAVNESSKKLWSSSSDGSLKAWSIPNLQELFSFSAEESLNEKLSLHAFWISPDEKKILLGTWDNKIIFINKDKPQQEIKVFEIPSQACLEIVELKKVNALLIFGCIKNYNVYLFDLLTENLFILPKISPTTPLFCAAVDKDEQTAYLCPFGGILPIKVSREEDNSFSFEGSLFLIPEIGTSTVAITPLTGNEIKLANSSGEVVVVNKANLVEKYKFKGNLKETIPSKAIKINKK